MQPVTLSNIPEVIETDRLILRCPQRGDGDQYFAALSETFEHLKPWFGSWMRTPPSKEAAEQWVLELRQKFLLGEELAYFVFTKSHNQFVGVAYARKVDWSVPKGMLGYWTRASFQRMGIAHEFLKSVNALLMEHLKFQRLELYIDPLNQPSVRLACKLGFCLEGRMRNYGYDNFGRMKDFFIYSMTPSDYFELLAYTACETTATSRKQSISPPSSIGSAAYCPLY